MGGIKISDIRFHLSDLITDVEDGVKIFQTCFTVTDQRIPILHELVQAFKSTDLRRYRISNELHVRPLVIPEQLNKFAVREPDPKPCLGALLNHVVQYNGFTAVGSTNDNEV